MLRRIPAVGTIISILSNFRTISTLIVAVFCS
jgi:hypothetical protein